MRRTLRTALLAIGVSGLSILSASAESLSTRIASLSPESDNIPPPDTIITAIEELGDEGVSPEHIDYVVKLTYAAEARVLARQFDRLTARLTYRTRDNVSWYLNEYDQKRVHALRERIIGALERSGYEATTLGISWYHLHLYDGIRIDG